MKLLLATAIATTLQSTSTYAQTSLTVFATSQLYTGNLGGVSGADDKCQALACSAGLVGNYKAWLSDGVSAPVNSFVQSTVPYQLVGGTPIANNFADVIDGNIQNPINRDENGNDVGNTSTINGPPVWTNTQIDGTSLGADCGDWSTDSGSVLAVIGSTSFFDRGSWTNNNQQFCSDSAQLYCFQQDDTDACSTPSPTSAPSKAPTTNPTPSLLDLLNFLIEDQGLPPLVAILIIILVIIGVIDAGDLVGMNLGAMLEDVQVGDGIRGRRILEDKEDIKALFVGILEEKLDLDGY